MWENVATLRSGRRSVKREVHSVILKTAVTAIPFWRVSEVGFTQIGYVTV
jgi:hypothetical protein